jgi:hypothetical protein
MGNPNDQKIARKTQVLISAITNIDKGNLEYEESRHKDGKVRNLFQFQLISINNTFTPWKLSLMYFVFYP